MTHDAPLAPPLTGLLCVDAGQTGMKIRVIDLADPTRAPIEQTLPGIRTNEALLPQLADAARTVLRLSGVASEVFTAGVSGLTEQDADAPRLLELLSGTPIRRVVLAHDSTTSYLGALGDLRGAVVAAGTGVVTLAVGERDVARVDGWGHAMGDAGSGFWIGREVLGAVMRAYDGRGPATTLTAVASEVWPSLPDAYIELQADRDWVRRVASFAHAAATHAEAGDAVAVSIIERAAIELARSTVTALQRVGADHDPTARVCTVGGVFRSPLLRRVFTDELHRAGVSATLEPSHGDGIDGVQALASLRADHPLSAYTSVSG